MEPVRFPECNRIYHPPTGMDESQCRTIHAWHGEAKGDTLDGLPVVVTAWLPSPEEIERINQGLPIYVSHMGGGLVPHYVTTYFQAATLNQNGA